MCFELFAAGSSKAPRDTHDIRPEDPHDSNLREFTSLGDRDVVGVAMWFSFRNI